jgi:anti-sigma factor RsiW
MVREHSERERRTRHRESWELLPWLANASLDDVQTQRLEEHLEQCAECRREYESQLQLQQQMQIQDQEYVLYTPHASLRKLMARIEQDDTAPAVAVDAPPPRHTRRVRWLSFAVAAQALGMVVLVGLMSLRFDYERNAPRYTTLSSAPAVIQQGPAARVVYSPALSLAELAELLRSYHAQVIAGPSDAGVYTLVFAAARDQKEVAATVARLRENPHVRFAEPAVADFGAGM